MNFHTEIKLPPVEGEDFLVGCSVYIVRGEREILRLKSLLIRFSELCGQQGTMQDLSYFLQKPGLMKRVPYLLLMARKSGANVNSLRPEDLVGSLLLLEYRILRVGTQAYATNDRSGRGTLLAKPQHRVAVAASFCNVLMKRRAKVAMLSFAGDSQSADADLEFQIEKGMRNSSRRVEWTVRSRTYASYLPLAATMDATMANLGQKTRSNMRYYRRRAEAKLGCRPVMQVDTNAKALEEFNQACMYPVNPATVQWRLKVMASLADPFLMGMQDAEGRWLSILGGRRFGDTTEILWQMNRGGFPDHSLGTVMRSYCMEHEIARGMVRLQVEGGTAHAMHHSFVNEEIVDLVVLRRPSRQLIGQWANRFLRPDNFLARMLVGGDDLHWHGV